MMNETQKLMLGVEALRIIYPDVSVGHWNKQEIREDYLATAEPVLEHAAPTVSEIEGMKSPVTIDESSDKWTAEGNQEREAPYGLVSKQDMIHAILEGDLETIDSSLIGANVALYAIDQDEDLSKEVRPDIRKYIEFNVSNAPKHQYFSKHDKIQFLKLLA